MDSGQGIPAALVSSESVKKNAASPVVDLTEAAVETG